MWQRVEVAFKNKNVSLLCCNSLKVKRWDVKIVSFLRQLNNYYNVIVFIYFMTKVNYLDKLPITDPLAHSTSLHPHIQDSMAWFDNCSTCFKSLIDRLWNFFSFIYEVRVFMLYRLKYFFCWSVLWSFTPKEIYIYIHNGIYLWLLKKGLARN